MRRIAPWAALAVTLVLAPRVARACCGFFAAGTGAPPTSPAMHVIVLRDGTRTVLTIEPEYAGPAAPFALVVPVPGAIAKGDVRTIDPAVVARVLAIAAPRLVETWEQDPCRAPVTPAPASAAPDVSPPATSGAYDVSILSATESADLGAWLERAHLALPPDAERVLRPYVDHGWRFVVATVDPATLALADGRAVLPPLRIAYDADALAIPLRLARLGGPDDTIVHVLSTAGRVRASDRPNAFVPTNLDVPDQARGRFAALYATLVDGVVADQPGVVVTEHASGAPAIAPADLAALGADVTPGGAGAPAFTLTRLHLRATDDDLVLAAAPAVAGGHERRGADGQLAHDAQAAPANAFAARYVIRHEWRGPIACASPRRGVWGADAPARAPDAAAPALAPLPPLPDPPPVASGGCTAAAQPGGLGTILFAMALGLGRRKR